MVEPHSSFLSSISAQFMIEATACETIQALDDCFLKFARALGFSSAMFVHLSSGGGAIAPRVVFGDQDPWIEHYAAQNYARLDPTIPRAFRSREAFTWGKVERPGAPRRERQFFGEAREAWAKDGLIVPIHGPFGEFSVVNLLCSRRILLADEEMAVIKSACNTYVSVALCLSQGALPAPPVASPPLTKRECQCVYWMCMGKHDAETAKILGLSVHTVRDYVDRAKSKLDAETRPELSLKALAFGLLVPDRGMMA